MSDADVKNTLSHETDDHPDSEMPRQLRTQADGETPLSRREADAGGVTLPVYGESGMDPNATDVDRDDDLGQSTST